MLGFTFLRNAPAVCFPSLSCPSLLCRKPADSLSLLKPRDKTAAEQTFI
jgi:hypothetical protein